MPRSAGDLMLNVPHLSPGSTDEMHLCFIYKRKDKQRAKPSAHIDHCGSPLPLPTCLITMDACVKTQYLLCRDPSLPDVSSGTETAAPWFMNPGLRAASTPSTSRPAGFCRGTTERTTLHIPSTPSLETRPASVSRSGLLHPKPWAPTGLRPRASVSAHLWAL